MAKAIRFETFVLSGHLDSLWADALALRGFDHTTLFKITLGGESETLVENERNAFKKHGFSGTSMMKLEPA